jgi:CBS-domain-containing membrane protein
MNKLSTYVFAWIGTAAALGVTAVLLHWTGHPWLLASFGGSCVILFGMPLTEMAQPRSFIGGHVLASVVGITFLRFGLMRFGGSSELWAIAAVATALVLMMMTRTIHSPAGANPLVVFAEHADWIFLLAPLLIGLVILFVTAYIVNNRTAPRRYPLSWT